MEVRIDVPIPHAFVLETERLQRIWAALAESVGPPVASAICVDHARRIFREVADLTRYENSRPRAIQALTIEARTKDYKLSSTVSFRYDTRPPIRLEVNGEEDAATPIRDRMIDVLTGLRPWYSALARVDFSYVLMVMFGLFIGMFLELLPIALKAPSTGPQSVRDLVWHSAQSYAEGTAVLVALFLCGRLYRRVFPLGEFAVGQGIERHMFLEKVRWGVVIAFAVSVLATIVTSAINK